MYPPWSEFNNNDISSSSDRLLQWYISYLLEDTPGSIPSSAVGIFSSEELFRDM